MGNDTAIFTIFFIIMVCNLLLIVSLILLGPSGNAYSEETLDRVRSYIKTIPTQSSHHARNESPLVQYMDPNLSVRDLYVCYLDWVLEAYPAEDDRPVKESKFRQIFNEEFNIKKSK